MIPQENARFRTKRTKRAQQWKMLPSRPEDFKPPEKDEWEKEKTLFDTVVKTKDVNKSEEKRKEKRAEPEIVVEGVLKDLLGKNDYMRVEFFKKQMYVEKGIHHSTQYKNDPGRLKCLEVHSREPFIGETPAIMLT